MADEAKRPGVPLPEQLPGEKDIWYKRFCKWLLMPGGRRVLLQVYNEEQRLVQADKEESAGLPHQPYKPAKSVNGSWKKAFKDYHWEQRSEAFDQSIRDETLDNWKHRQEKNRQAEWEDAATLRERARLLLALPATRQRIDEGSTEVNGQTVAVRSTIIEPVKPVHLRTATLMLDEASKLARLASGDVTSHSSNELTGADGAPLGVGQAPVVVVLPDNGRHDTTLPLSQEGPKSAGAENEPDPPE